jgi:hypothetical protein
MAMTNIGRLVLGACVAAIASSCGSSTATQAPKSPTSRPAPPARPAPQTASTLPSPTPAAAALPARALIIGGGPDRLHNQIAIESNVRYVGRILPKSASYQVLFTDGNPESDTVQYQDGRTLAYRAPNLPRLDGNAETASVRTALASTATAAHAAKAADVILYFTGHGSGDRASNFTNNWFDLWNGGRLRVKDLAASIEAFPAETPITLIMVQCFSGAFGNVLFQGGDPQGAVIDRHIAGFFAAVPERTSAGCTPAVNEADYKDFTGYFFAALTGEDRMGRPIASADYDHDSRVEMDEAFAWSLINDDSIDTPVRTSDTFLRRFAAMPDDQIAATPFASLESWASPAERVALEGLSTALQLAGDDRLRAAFTRFNNMRPGSQALPDVKLIRFINLSRSVVEAHALNASNDASAKRRLADIRQAEHRNPFK